LRRHPGESRDPAAVDEVEKIVFFPPEIPAFAGMTELEWSSATFSADG